MILVVSNSKDATADFLCNRMQREAVAHVRVDTDHVAQAARIEFTGQDVALCIGTSHLLPSDVTCVWLRRPDAIEVDASDPAEALHTGSEWAAALEGFMSVIPKARWINHPSANAGASYKIEQLPRASRFGLQVPTTIVTQDPDFARRFIETHAGGVVVKPLAGGYVERDHPDRDTQIFTSRVEPEHLKHFSLVSRCPTMLQVEVSKATDVRLTSIDDSMIAVSLQRQASSGDQILDIRRDNMRGVEYRTIDVPVEVSKPLAALLRSYELRFAAVDFAVDRDGTWWFLEVNPSGQWAWLDQAGVTNIAKHVLDAMRA